MSERKRRIRTQLENAFIDPDISPAKYDALATTLVQDFWMKGKLSDRDKLKFIKSFVTYYLKKYFKKEFMKSTGRFEFEDHIESLFMIIFGTKGKKIVRDGKDISYFECSRQAAKSFVLYVSIVIILRYRIYGAVTYYSYTNTQLEKHLNKIWDMIYDNIELAKLIIPRKDRNIYSKKKKKKEKFLETVSGVKFYANSCGDSIRGESTEIIFLDDMNAENVSLAVREKINTYVFSAVIPTASGGKIVMVDTPRSVNDLGSRFKKIPFIKYQKHPAYRKVKVRKKGRTEEIDVPICRWMTMETLKNIELQVGAQIFSQEYMCEIVADKTRIFSDATIEAAWIDPEELNVHSILETKDRAYNIGNLYIGVDLSHTESNTGDYTVFMLIAEINKKLYIFDYKREREINFHKIIEYLREIYEMYEDFRPKLTIEANSADLVVNLLADLPALKNRITPFKTNVKNKSSPINGIPRLAALMQSGLLRIALLEDNPDPDAPDAERKRAIFSQELRGWTYDEQKDKYLSGAKHDDTTMALFVGLQPFFEKKEVKQAAWSIDLGVGYR